jgi:hypothetical protein
MCVSLHTRMLRFDASSAEAVLHPAHRVHFSRAVVVLVCLYINDCWQKSPAAACEMTFELFARDFVESIDLD